MSEQEKGISRREMLEITMGLTGLALAGGVSSVAAQESKRTPTRIVTIDAKPEAISIDTARTAVIVVDMQNDFGSEGGMLQRAGLDVSPIQAAVAPTAKVLEAARKEGIKVIYLKMAFKPDLSDAGSDDAVNRVRHLRLKVGKSVPAPNGKESRILIRDTWNTDILAELTPKADDIVLYKNRFSGFYNTELDAVLKRLGIKYLILTGCLTSVCVESTARDAMFRDYLPVVFADCTGEAKQLTDETSLVRIERFFGWVSKSDNFIKGLEAPVSPATS
jgi:ureidoacrylate peracid hydrolase